MRYLIITGNAFIHSPKVLTGFHWIVVEALLSRLIIFQYWTNKCHTPAANVTPAVPYESSKKTSRIESLDSRDFWKIL